MHVLVGTDGSDEAVAAAVSGLGLLDSVEEVTLVCVVDNSSILMSGHESGFAGGMATDEEVAEVRQRNSAEASSALEVTAEAIAEVVGDAEIESRIDEGDAGPLLSALAGELDVDAVVVGSQGKGAIKRALLGSVSGHVVNNAPCPVVVVRRGTD
jgi:nucleotide-binding universal stress UspA family protein